MGRAIASNFLTLLIVLLIAAAVAVGWGRSQYTGPGPSAVAQCVNVPQGASLKLVSDQLEAQGAISNGYIFRTGADYEGKSGDLKFGSYMVKPRASMRDVVAAITAGGPSTCGAEVTYRVGVRGDSIVLRDIDPDSGAYIERVKYDPASETAPAAIGNALKEPAVRLRIALAEGVTSWQVVEGLKAATFLSGEVGSVPPEGRLAPDTYIVAGNADRAKLLTEMQTRQDAILAKAWENRAPGLPYKNAAEALIMASIVEKETGIAAERPQVASVFVNRLNQKMRLETDPTVIYGLTEGKSVMDRGLRRSELLKRTRYNTYQIAALPPTPIANPGKAAIEAALHPADTGFLFFVADGSGGHVFARTLDEHRANVVKWREIEKSRGQAADSPVQGGN